MIERWSNWQEVLGQKKAKKLRAMPLDRGIQICVRRHTLRYGSICAHKLGELCQERVEYVHDRRSVFYREDLQDLEEAGHRTSLKILKIAEGLEEVCEYPKPVSGRRPISFYWL